MAHIIVAQAGKSFQYIYANGGYLISYHLKEPLSFDEPHFARLLSVDGVGRPCLVFADFVKPQHVNGESHPFLGSWSSSNIVAPWVPLTSNHIPSTGYIQVKRSDEVAMTNTEQNKSSLTFIIEIAPRSMVSRS